MTWIWSAAALVGVLAILYVMAKRHFHWVAKQSPLGNWTHERGTRQVLLAFEGDRRNGTYKQLTRDGDDVSREFGAWRAFGHDLHLLVIASDQKDHPRFGVDTNYTVFYPTPNRIRIFGGDRNVVFNRAAAELAGELNEAFATMAPTQKPT
jgi:hypothetical protein